MNAWPCPAKPLESLPGVVGERRAAYTANPRAVPGSILPARRGRVFPLPGISWSACDGSVDFGITGSDVLAERTGENNQVLAIHPALGFGHCTLNVIVPEAWDAVERRADLAPVQSRLERPLRVATKFPSLTQAYFASHGLTRSS
jgi:ATP phosphoribosyltransferase